MPHQRQIFQSESRLRWKSFIWAFRTVLFLTSLIVAAFLVSLFENYNLILPKLKNEEFNLKKLSKPINVKELSVRDRKIYKGFDLYLSERKKNEGIRNAERGSSFNQKIRAGFYVDWDPQSFYSLQKHISKLNTLFPEWFFIDPHADTLVVKVDSNALALIKNYPVKILPILSNVDYTQRNGSFLGTTVHRIFHNANKRDRLITSVINALDKYKFQGVDIDFEELNEDGDEPMIGFAKQFHEKLKEKNLLLVQDIMPSNEDFNIPELAKYNDYLLLMAYDQHYSISHPGPVSEQRWIEKTLDEAAREIPSEKIILGLAAYGYDWPEGNEANAITYQKALANANIYNQQIAFNNDTYNDYYSYTDDEGLKHDVYFTDAITNFNVMRFADEYGTAGTALWRLGAEDERLWTFYDRNLSDEALTLSPYNFNRLSSIELSNEKPDYDGDGEIMDVIAKPQKGIINLEIDSSERIISEQVYKQLPTRYVIRKYGNVNKQVVLTFDDGPDRRYTPQILDILKEENIKAAFFIIGINGETNLPLLKRIVREGHEIGNHTFTHPNMAAVSAARAQSELSSTRLLIEAATGRSTVLYRIPYNADSEPTNAEELRPVALGKENNYYTIGESVDPLDWQPNVTADTILQRVIKKYESNPNKGIILLHDSGGDREATVKALPGIIHYFKQKGIQFISLSQLVGKSDDELMPLVNSDLLTIDSGLVVFLYWVGRILLSAFWAAIVLFLIKTLAMGVMATIQFYRTKSAQLIFPIPVINEQVTVIVPAYNEEVNAVATIASLLKQTYAGLKIIFVDDGSTDSTLEKVRSEFANEPRVTVISKQNGGKASALNEGIRHADTPYVVCIDGDTQLKPDAVERLMAGFISAGNDDKIVGAVAGNVKVGNRKNMLTWWQHIEYTTAQNFDRRAFDLINGITVVPGAIGAFDRSAVIEAGGFTSDTLAEDCDLTIRLLRLGYTVRNCTDAIAITEAPETFKQFMKQRFRWSYGVMQSFWKNRNACFNPEYKALGMVSLPNILIYQIILPVLAPLADLMLLISLFWSRNDSAGMEKILFYYVVFLFVDALISVVAFAFEKEKIKHLLWLIPQRFIYRQLMYVVLFRSIKKAIKGEIQGWGVLKRTGNVKPSFK